MHVLAQESGGGLLPDWLADAPPWLQALALVLALGAALGTLTAPVWGPALADRIRGRSTPSTVSTAAPADSPTGQGQGGSSGPALAQYDQQMALIDRMVSGLQQSLDDAEEEAARLRARLDEVQAQLADARAEIGKLTYQRDLLLQQRAEPRRRDA